MRPAGFQINELRLRASGLTPDQARRLGEIVAKRLSEVPLAGRQSQRITSLRLRVQSRANDSLEQMADDIAHHVRRRVG